MTQKAVSAPNFAVFCHLQSALQALKGLNALQEKQRLAIGDKAAIHSEDIPQGKSC